MWLNAETAGGVSVLQRQLFKLVLGQSPAGIGCERAAQIVRRPMSDRLAAVCFAMRSSRRILQEDQAEKPFSFPLPKIKSRARLGCCPIIAAAVSDNGRT